jgi:cytochrome P450/NADPH-cytochrome P450 reductase
MPVTIRRSLKDGMLGRYRIRTGDIILVGTLAAQRDPRYWGSDPQRFDPEQFSPEKVVDRPRHAFIPFSIGKRQCMAQEVTFMMLRVVLFEMYKRYQLRLAPGASVEKNTVVTTKPASVPIIRLRREHDGHPRTQGASREASTLAVPAATRDWGEPTEIAETSPYRELVIAYGSNFGANKELAERFAERGRFYGYTSHVVTLNELVESPPRTHPWLLAVMTSTYTSNPPSNATAFKAWLDHADPGSETWEKCRYLVWGLGNSQWNAFLAFPRYVHKKLSELGAQPLAEFAYGDVGSPTWERLHAEWNTRIWPVLLQLSEARQAHQRRLQHRNGDVAQPCRQRPARPACPEDPHQLGGDRHFRRPRAQVHRTPSTRIAEADSTSGGHAPGRPPLPSGRPPRRLPGKRRGAGRTARNPSRGRA